MKRIIKHYTHYTDHELLEFIRRHDEQAFTVLYERYYLALCKKAFQRIQSVPRVEEIVQDVFVNLWSKASSLHTESHVKAYLYATLRNKILHELRQEYTRAAHMENLKIYNNNPGEENKSLQTIYAQEAEAHIYQIVTTLSPQCREAFLLSRFEELSYKEIAERMHLSVNTVEKHVAKALHILRSKLNTYSDIPVMLLVVYLCCL